MKKVLKSRIFLVLATAIIVGSIGVYAGSQILASDITYNDGTVDDALDDLYDKANSTRTETQVATLTTQGATYTMQNDGYITGTASSATGETAAIVYMDNKGYVLSHFNQVNVTANVSLYAKKNTVLSTRSDGGNYNLTVYEWK